MKLSAQEEYGLRCLVRLARFARESSTDSRGLDEEPSLTVNDIAAREGLSPQYVGKLIRLAARYGVVESVRGRKGGYRLARPARSITLLEALSALGSKVYSPETCSRFAGDRSRCVHSADCSIRSLWSGIQWLIDSVLSTTTLHDLTEPELSVAERIRPHLAALGRAAPAGASVELEARPRRLAAGGGS